MPRGLYRLHHSGSAHFITFTCYHRYAHLLDAFVRDLFVRALERTRKLYRMRVYGFVVMPEHVHLLVSEPERGTVANAIQSLKITSAKQGKEVLNSHISQLKGNVGRAEVNARNSGLQEASCGMRGKPARYRPMPGFAFLPLCG